MNTNRNKEDEKLILETTNGVFDFVFIILLILIGLILYWVLSSDVVLKKFSISLILSVIAYVLGYFHVSKIKIYSSRILINFPFRNRLKRNSLVKRGQIYKIRFGASSMRNPPNLIFYYRDNKSKKTFQLSEEDEVIMDMLNEFVNNDIILTEYPKGSLREFGFKISKQ